MKTLRDEIQDAQKEGRAIGHFNVGNLEMLTAVVNAIRATGLPAIVGVSEGERDAFGVAQIAALIGVYKEEGLPVYLNADHTYSVERVKEAIDAGFDSVIFDGAKLSLEENIAKAKECVVYAKKSDYEVLVEAELGYIGSGSQLLDAIPEGAVATEDMMTKPDEAERFVKETDVDLFAPAVGNIHGLIKGYGNPKLSIERVRDVAAAAGIPLVLHGGSGITDQDFIDAIKAGISVIHISTELRLADRQAMTKSLSENADELAPYKLSREAITSVEAIVERYIKLFAGK
ncbi:MAG: class II fructose-bisphosphate aldolase [Patescibacteria group bacterium]